MGLRAAEGCWPKQSASVRRVPRKVRQERVRDYSMCLQGCGSGSILTGSGTESKNTRFAPREKSGSNHLLLSDSKLDKGMSE